MVWSAAARLGTASCEACARPRAGYRAHSCHYLGYLLLALGVHVVFLSGARDIRTYGWVLLYTLVTLIVYAGFHRGWGLMEDAAAAIDRSIQDPGERLRVAALASRWFGPTMQAGTLVLGALVSLFALSYGVEETAGRSRPLAAYVILMVAGAMGATALAFFGGFIAISYCVTHSPHLRIRGFAPEDTPALRELVRTNRFATGLALAGFLVFSFPLVWVFARTPLGEASPELVTVVIATFLLTLGGMLALAVLPNIWFIDVIHRERWRRLDRHRVDVDMHGQPVKEAGSRQLEDYRAAAGRASTRPGTFAIFAGVFSVLIALAPYLIAAIARR